MFASPLVQKLLGGLIGFYMLLCGWTTRWRRVNEASAAHFWASRERVIMCVWHGRFMQVHVAWRLSHVDAPGYMLISQSREGGVVATAARTVGATDVVRGSAAKRGQQKGGFEALRQMVRLIGEGGVICLTPDGPRGPRMRAQMGPIQLAKLSGAALMPIAWSTKWGATLGSWDRMQFPAPFGRGVLIWGQPIHVPRGADAAAMEAARLALETEMNRITAEADRLMGKPPIEPAPASAEAEAEAASA